MHYSEKESHVRVDIFKPSGKWYASGMVDMSDAPIEGSLTAALCDAMDKYGISGLSTKWQDWLREGGTIVCLEPCHKFSHPILLTEGGYRA